MNSRSNVTAATPDKLDAGSLLASCKIEVAAESFTLVALRHSEFAELLQNTGISPRGASPFFIFSDKDEVTLMLADDDIRLVRHALDEARIESGFRLVTFDIVLEFDVVGFYAEISRILAEASVPIVAVSAYSRDHLLIKQDDLARALAALGGVNEDLC